MGYYYPNNGQANGAEHGELNGHRYINRFCRDYIGILNITTNGESNGHGMEYEMEYEMEHEIHNEMGTGLMWGL